MAGLRGPVAQRRRTMPPPDAKNAEILLADSLELRLLGSNNPPNELHVPRRVVLDLGLAN
ncbi:MAG: hypothetical protein CL489_05480 [Acidobacteria bacterium]|nr:hypothetical protein [Acidobacteriota bacterium]